MRATVFTILFLAPILVFGQAGTKNLDDDLKSIIDSTMKSSEKPLSDQNVCGFPCKTGINSDKGCECTTQPALVELEKNAPLGPGSVVVLLSGEKYELKKHLKFNKVAIFSKIQIAKPTPLFDIKDGNIFIGRQVFTFETEDQRFIREYRLLEEAYLNLKFKELCKYLAENNPKYRVLSKQISPK